ncbi:MAG: SDR family oxidoreductase, partial [Deltaproteobacteria bacterium]|nr:SDR family oxidoreductase [Deltaproteobacteria bacterium]
DLAADLVGGDAGSALLGIAQASALAPRHSRLVAIVDEPAAATAHQTMLAAATAGLLRSLHKELGPAASTCHLLRLAGADPLAVADVAGLLLSPASAFLTALDLRLTADIGPRVEADERVALVTGAARGIGAAIARRLAASGWRVLVNDVAQARATAEATLQGITAAGGRGEFVPADCSAAAGAEAIASAVRAHGRLDAVVHNAGITRDRTVRRMTAEQWHQVLGVNLHAMERVQTAVDPYLRAGAGIAMLSSVMGIAGNFGQCNYTASKAGVLALMRLWSDRLAPRGVRCNAIAPGFIVTDMTAKVPLFNREMAKQLTALLQPGLPEDVAELAAFLVHPASRAVTGQTLRCDGGMAFGA